MTASEGAAHGGERLHLYVASEAWPLIADLVDGFHGEEDQRGAVVGTARGFEIYRLPDSAEAERLLDRHWIVHMTGDTEGRRTAERCFFDGIADRYELEVDPQRNRDNVRALMQLAGVRPGRRVLDFGCGPGLSIREADQVDLVGCDVSPAMREQAAAHGLPTVGPENLRSLEGSFDAMVASYVLHLAVPQADLLAAMRCVRVGGKVAANFHKARGLVEVAVAVSIADVYSAVEVESIDHPLHGSIRVWERIR